MFYGWWYPEAHVQSPGPLVGHCGAQANEEISWNLGVLI